MKRYFTLLLLVVVANIHAQQFTTEEPEDIASFPEISDEYPFGILDINNDGFLDFIGYQFFTGSTRILVSDGSLFNQSEVLEIPTFVEFMDSGDYNGDGIIDFLTEQEVYYNNGDNIFTNVSLPHTGVHYTGDFNADGIDDFITYVDIPFENKQVVTLCNADNTFGLSTITSELSSDGLAVAHLNDDDHLDFATIITGDVEIYLGDGAGNFEKFEEYHSNFGRYQLTATDLDADGDNDLVWGTSFSEIGWRLNNGDGTFGSSNILNISDALPPLNRCVDMIAADYDNDGYNDLLLRLVNSSESSVIHDYLAINNGSGEIGQFAFEMVDSYSGETVNGTSKTHYANVDIDTDGDMDIIVNRGTYVGLFRNNQPSSITNLKNEVNIEISPNPFKDAIYLKSETAFNKRVTVELRAATGQLINTYTGQLPMTIESDINLVNGLYYLLIKSGTQKELIATGKLFKLN